MVQPSPKEKEIIDNIKYITVATADENGQPWNTPVTGFHFENDYTFYWASWSENQHSKNICKNSKAFIVIYDSTPDNGPTPGVYMLAEAKELTDEQEIMEAARVFKNDQYNPADGKEYTGTKPRRIYKAMPQKIWLNTDSKVDGNFVDKLLEAQG
jgi:general stress protein 26